MLTRPADQMVTITFEYAEEHPLYYGNMYNCCYNRFTVTILLDKELLQGESIHL